MHNVFHRRCRFSDRWLHGRVNEGVATHGDEKAFVNVDDVADSQTAVIRRHLVQEYLRNEERVAFSF